MGSCFCNPDWSTFLTALWKQKTGVTCLLKCAYCDGHRQHKECEVCACVACTCMQVIIQSGQPPTVLQQLCSLPFPYFSDSSLTNILFPTLVSCCYLVDRNREILQQELSCALLANFIEVGLVSHCTFTEDVFTAHTHTHSRLTALFPGLSG